MPVGDIRLRSNPLAAALSELSSSAVLGHLGARKLKQLGQLLEHVIGGLGTFP
jgi:hypothetical protein